MTRARSKVSVVSQFKVSNQFQFILWPWEGICQFRRRRISCGTNSYRPHCHWQKGQHYFSSVSKSKRVISPVWDPSSRCLLTQISHPSKSSAFAQAPASKIHPTTVILLFPTFLEVPGCPAIFASNPESTRYTSLFRQIAYASSPEELLRDLSPCGAATGSNIWNHQWDKSQPPLS